MNVSVLTMYEKLYDGAVREVVLPGDDGELSVWDHHQPCLYSLRKGKITIVSLLEAEGGFKPFTSIPIKRGIVHIESNRLTAMVEI
jgi:F0F1-type ATP synthase epsilon subunit